MTTKVETSRGDWLNSKGNPIPYRIVGDTKFPAYVVDLADWLEGTGSKLSAGDISMLLGDRSAAALHKSAMELVKNLHIHRYVLKVLIREEIPPRCDKAVLSHALTVIVKRRQLVGR